MSRFCLRLFAVLTLAATGGMLSACSGSSVSMEPAQDAAAPACANVTVRLPEQVDGLSKRDTNAQATGAWGNPANVLLRCGVPTPGPTSDRCIELNDVDWVEDASQAPTYRYTTYGRTPAVEVVINAQAGVSGTNALMDLHDAVNTLPVTGACIGPEDVLDTP